ncbi:hypothetical protein K1X84_10750 [bacterium]|nr:hypothetical protein [bacterium]
MPKVTMLFGFLFIALGVGGYFVTDRVSVTALIPAFFGIALVILGYIARKENLRKHMMHIAVLLGLLGLIGSFSGLIKLFTLLSGNEVARPAAVVSQSIMAIACLVFVMMCVYSFISARIAKKV